MLVLLQLSKYYPGICLEQVRKIMKTTVGINGILAMIQIEHILHARIRTLPLHQFVWRVSLVCARCPNPENHDMNTSLKVITLCILLCVAINTMISVINQIIMCRIWDFLGGDYEVSYCLTLFLTCIISSILKTKATNFSETSVYNKPTWHPQSVFHT
jgi:hypothetical protein